MNRIALEAQAVTIERPRPASPILADVSLTLAFGEVHALVGPNGAGKSTLLGVLAGDRQPDHGRVLIDGQPVTALSARALARRRSVLMQHNPVTFAFTARQVVEMGRAPWLRTPAADEDAAAVEEALAAADVAHLAGRPISALSGGERARVALARVLAQRTRVLLLDEPTAALDLRHQEDVLGIARAQAAAGSCVAVVLHDLDAALAYSDRVTLLDHGRIVASGAPIDVLTPDRIAAVYGQPVDVFPNPVTGRTVIVPRR